MTSWVTRCCKELSVHHGGSVFPLRVSPSGVIWPVVCIVMLVGEVGTIGVSAGQLLSARAESAANLGEGSSTEGAGGRPDRVGLSVQPGSVSDLDGLSIVGGWWPQCGCPYPDSTTDTITSPFGPRRLDSAYDYHEAIDIDFNGQYVHAVADGKVTWARVTISPDKVALVVEDVLISQRSWRSPTT